METKMGVKITKRTEKHLRGYKFIKIGNHTYQFTINIERGSSSMGFNSDYCIKMFTDNGWKYIVDNRFLGISDIDTYYLMDEKTTEKIDEDFKIFLDYINEIEGVENVGF